MSTTILIAEDDRKLNEGILLALQSDELQFVQCYSCREIREALENQIPDLMILDVNFPDGNGMDILKEIQQKELPIRIVMLTANNMETDVVTGLELGAADYITKPFSLMVLRARVRVQLREIEKKEELSKSQAIISEDKDIFTQGIYEFNFAKMQFYISGKEIILSKTEQKLLRILVENKGHIVTRETLIDEVWDGYTEYVDAHALAVAMKRLRDKVGDTTAKESCIKNIYGCGYTWVVNK